MRLAALYGARVAVGSVARISHDTACDDRRHRSAIPRNRDRVWTDEDPRYTLVIDLRRG